MSKTYILAILSGVLVFMCVYIFFNVSFEKFTAAAEPPPSLPDLVDDISRLLLTVGNGEIPAGYVYIEDITKVVNHNDLLLYYTSFSEKTNYNKEVDTYMPLIQKWNNFIKDNQPLNIITGTSVVLPSTLKLSANTSGLSLTNTRLEGLRPDEINTEYTLKPFSISFYLKITSRTLDFVNEGHPDTLDLFSISLEHPNTVKLNFEKDANDADKVNISFQVGTDDINKRSLSFPKNAITNSTCCITATYSVNNTVGVSINNKHLLNIYVNQIAEEAHIGMAAPTDPLVVGNSRISINKNVRITYANIIAFIYYKKPLTYTEHSALYDYLTTQNTEIVSVYSTIQTVATNQINTLQQLVTQQVASSQSIKSQLDQCLSTQAEVETAQNENRFNITMDGIANVSTENLQQCSVLKINNPSETDTPVVTAPPTPATPATPATSTSSFPFNIVIPFLRGVTPKDYNL